MLTHTIIKYKPHVHVVPTTSHLPAVQHTPVVQASQLLLHGKHSYAQFIKEIPYTKGAFVISRSTVWPYQKPDMWKVKDIQEIWYMCPNKDTDKPCPVQLINQNGETRWVSHKDYFKVNIPSLEF